MISNKFCALVSASLFAHHCASATALFISHGPFSLDPSDRNGFSLLTNPTRKACYLSETRRKQFFVRFALSEQRTESFDQSLTGNIKGNIDKCEISGSDENNPINLHLFLRFSPLINGPSFLPLHSEVIFVVGDTMENDIFGMTRGSADNSASLAPPIRIAKLHRLDFLPANPTDPSTVVRLLLFLPVPGNVRYRLRSFEDAPEGHNGIAEQSCRFPTFEEARNLVESIGTPTMSFRGVDAPDDFIFNKVCEVGSGSAIALPVCSIACKNSDAALIVSSAVEFANNFRASYGEELRIFGGKNCISFALDLLTHMDKEHAIGKEMKLPWV